MLTHVFIANRGEIAARIARTCHRLGIGVTVSSGEYLDPAAQIAQAVAAGADSVHPGYGFLSENPDFARAVTDAGLVWIGPPPEAMVTMARKDHAREVAVAAGVPVVPRGEDAGFPVLVKAAAGGGGKGMRVVREASELEEAKAAAAREARGAFGDDTLLIEKY
ncbi:MAG: biotin carboxylase N-terminal domain-containing protein, partial [Nocardioides sp.]